MLAIGKKIVVKKNVVKKKVSFNFMLGNAQDILKQSVRLSKYICAYKIVGMLFCLVFLSPQKGCTSS